MSDSTIQPLPVQPVQIVKAAQPQGAEVLNQCANPMTKLKRTIGYTATSAFVFFSALGTLGALGFVPIQKAALPWVFGVALTQSISWIVAIIKSEHYFRDPAVEHSLREEMSKMKIRHAEEMAELKRAHSDQLHEVHADYRQRHPQPSTNLGKGLDSRAFS